METRELSGIIESIAPLSLQEEWDNSGIQVDPGGVDVDGILLSLDCTLRTVREAVDKGCQAIIAHHPLIFRPLSRLSIASPTEATVIEALVRRIFIYAMHTPLDQIYHDRLTRILGLEQVGILFPAGDGKTGFGYGALANNPGNENLATFLPRLKDILGVKRITYGGDEAKIIRSIAILNGSGGSKIGSIVRNHTVDLVITGDVSYHQMQDAVEAGIAVVDAGHFGTEQHLMALLKDDLEVYLTNTGHGRRVKLFLSDSDQSPMKFF